MNKAQHLEPAATGTSRRSFLKASGVAGGGLVFGFSLAGCSAGPLPLDQAEGALQPDAFLQVLPDGQVRFYCPRDEMGQGVTTGLTTLVAEELDVHPQRIDVRFAGAHPDYANPQFRIQITGGSTSISAHYEQLRQAGANVRAVLVEAAAADLGVPVDAISTDDGHILVNGDRYGYGEFVATAARLQAPSKAPLKSPEQFRYIGTEFPRLDAMAKATGTAVFGIDVEVPGMHHAVVHRCPVAGGRLRAIDNEAEIARRPGVTDVVALESGVAVVAGKFWQAHQAAAAVQAQWELPALAKVDSAQVRADYERALEEEDGTADAVQGDLEAGFAEGRHSVEASYWAPYLAHAPLEPMNAVLRIEDGGADIWTGTQLPGVVQGLVARYTGLDAGRIRVHNTYLGGGFGRRGTATHITEVAQIVMAAGKPVKLQWTREDDLRNGVYRPASLMRLKAAVAEDGRITAWQAKRVGDNITPDTLAHTLPGVMAGVPEGLTDWMAARARGLMASWLVDYTSIEGLHEDYDWPNREVRHVTYSHGLPVTFWRSVGHSYTAFAKEVMVDELAAAAGLDPVALRLTNTRNKPRLQAVIRRAGEGMPLAGAPAGRHRGFAAHSSFNTDVAQTVEISVEDGRIRVHKVLCVVDCGRVINPDIVRTQMEGAIMFGLTAALHGDLHLEQGAIRESNFHDYPLLRMNEAPDVEVVIVDSDAPPTGVGEPGLPPIAPAVANAVFAATGRRLRELPLRLA